MKNHKQKEKHNLLKKKNSKQHKIENDNIGNFNFGIEEQKMTFKEHELQLKAQEAAARKTLEKKGFKDYFKKKYLRKC